jgi:hypothetical protein
MADHLGMLLAGPIVPTTEVVEDVDGNTWPLGGGPDPIFCLNKYWFLQVTSQTVVITPVGFQSQVPSFAMTNSP